MKEISVACTLLRSFGVSLQQQKLKLNSSLVYDSFLLDMSFHLPFIDWFVISDCRFDGEHEENVTINMSDTKFTHITYIDDFIDMEEVYLKLTTLDNNTTRWYFIKNRMYNTCTENDYHHSLQKMNSLSLFIQC